MPRPTTNPKLYIALTFATLVLGGAASYFQSTVASEGADRVAKLRSEARDPDQLQREVEQSSLDLQATSEKLAHLEKGVPQMAYVPTLLQELEARGKQNGIEVLGVRPIVTTAPANPKEGDNKKPRKAYTELDIEVRGRGNYASTKRFVHDLQAFPKILAARTVSLMPKQDLLDPSGAPLLEMTIQLRAYLFDATLEAEKVEAVKPTLSSHRKEVKAYE